LTFHADWRVELTAPLVADAEVCIRYDKRRLLASREQVPAQQHSFTITGYCRFNGESLPFTLGGGRPESSDDFFCEHVLRVPRAAMRLELWFQRSGLYGEVKYDSDYGRNYSFMVFPTIDMTNMVRAYVGEVTRRVSHPSQ
jgi:hypothetical protein